MSWQPELVQVLDLSGQHLRVLHMAGLVNLRQLNLAANELTSLVDSGLCGCTALVNLVLAKNRIHDEASLRYLRLLPSLFALDMSENDVMQKVPKARYCHTDASALPNARFRCHVLRLCVILIILMCCAVYV